MTTTAACLSSLYFRLSRLRAGLPVLACASLLAMLSVLHGAAWAQAPGQYGAAIDPPGRVARLNLVEGAVSFAPADATGSPEANAWTPALLNRPLTSGDRLWTAPRARSELHIGSMAVRMSEQTSLDFLTLDDNAVQLRLAQGSIRLRVRTLFEGQRLEINTPNLAFVITQPGDYRLDANPANNTTRVVALSGAGVIYGDSGEAVNLGSQQQASFTGTQLTPAGPGAAVQDSFDAWVAERDRREDQSVSARYVPRETLGYQQLDSYGDWHQDATYGAVWLPHAVPVNWAPYRMGHWSWIAPWGWTWIDDAPWGFAPCHYGRWARIGPRWAWVPGRLAARPVYAPALVAFVGGHSGGVHWNIAIGSGGASLPSVGWFPLAPGEAFRPAYRVSPRYVTEVNHNIVVNNTVNVTNIYRYQRQPAAVTAVSRDDFARGRPVRGNLHALSANDLSRAQVVADHSAIPQRPDMRERPRPAAAAALPPAAVVVRPVVGSREERREDRRDDRRDAKRDERPQDRGGDPLAQTPVPAAPAAPVAPPRSPLLASPDVGRSPLATPQDRPAIDAENRARREQQQLQRDQERQQGALTRQQDIQRRQAEESLGQRALREQAQKNANLPPPTLVRPADQDARAAAERSAAEQAQRAQQQLQRDQQRQQVELARQQEQQRRHNDELAGQRAMREQAQRQQAQQQHEQREQARQMHEQQRQQQALQQQRAQQDQQRRNEELLGQRALREQAQRQQEQQRQQQALQHQQQQQQRAQQDQQRQAHEQSQRQQQELRRQQAEEKQQARQTDAAHAREPRPEGGPRRHREQ